MVRTFDIRIDLAFLIFETVSRSVAEPLNSFIPLLNQISPPLAHRLEFLGHDLITSNFGASHGLGLQVGSMPLGTVVGGPPVLSRAGLLVLLESLVRFLCSIMTLQMLITAVRWLAIAGRYYGSYIYTCAIQGLC